MQKRNVRNPIDALAYLLDCSLATVDDLAMKKNPPKNEFIRQIEIAQTNLDWAINFGSDISGTRGQELVDRGISVDEYARQMHLEFHPQT